MDFFKEKYCAAYWLNTYNVKLEAENYNIYVDTEKGILECKHCHS